MKMSETLFQKIAFRKTISVDRIDACGELIRREAHTRFGAFLSTGLNVRPAPLTEGGFLHHCSSSDDCIWMMPLHRLNASFACLNNAKCLKCGRIWKDTDERQDKKRRRNIKKTEKDCPNIGSCSTKQQKAYKANKREKKNKGKQQRARWT